MPKRPRFTHPMRAIRTAIGISQSGLADLVGCSVHTIQAVENGRLAVSPTLEARFFVETGADTKELVKGRKGKALDQNGRPYSKEYYRTWKERWESYDNQAALRDFDSLLADAARQGKSRELLVQVREWFYDWREALRETSQS